ALGDEPLALILRTAGSAFVAGADVRWVTTGLSGAGVVTRRHHGLTGFRALEWTAAREWPGVKTERAFHAKHRFGTRRRSCGRVSRLCGRRREGRLGAWHFWRVRMAGRLRHSQSKEKRALRRRHRILPHEELELGSVRSAPWHQHGLRRSIDSERRCPSDLVSLDRKSVV